MIPKPLRPFMGRLLEATNNSEIAWKEAADDAFFAVQKNANLHIRYVFDPDTGESGYTFQISRAGDDPFFSVSNSEDDYFFMRNLFSAISVNAAGGGKIVDDLFD